MDWNSKKQDIMNKVSVFIEEQLELIKPMESEQAYEDEISDLTAEIDGYKCQMDTIVNYVNRAQSYLGDIECSLDDIKSEAYYD